MRTHVVLIVAVSALVARSDAGANALRSELSKALSTSATSIDATSGLDVSSTRRFLRSKTKEDDDDDDDEDNETDDDDSAEEDDSGDDDEMEEERASPPVSGYLKGLANQFEEGMSITSRNFPKDLDDKILRQKDRYEVDGQPISLVNNQLLNHVRFNEDVAVLRNAQAKLAAKKEAAKTAKLAAKKEAAKTAKLAADKQ